MSDYDTKESLRIFEMDATNMMNNQQGSINLFCIIAIIIWDSINEICRVHQQSPNISRDSSTINIP